MQRKLSVTVIIPLLILLCCNVSYGQQTDSMQATKKSPSKEYKNVIRYNFSGALVFGLDKYIIFGYERVVNPHQSFSINVGGIAFPKLINILTDSFFLQRDAKNDGFNVSVDYRFYLPHENKYHAPHGVYVGPYFSYNHFNRENNWTFQRSGSGQELIDTDLKFNIFTIGGELGYQFVFWKRMTVDLVLIGPGISGYNLTLKQDGELTEAQQENLADAVKQLITQKFPGMNYVFADQELKANGTVSTTSIGYRYLIHIGFRF